MTTTPAFTESIRLYLRLYALPGNVAAYLHAPDTHDTVAERIAVNLAEWLAARPSAPTVTTEQVIDTIRRRQQDYTLRGVGYRDDDYDDGARHAYANVANDLRHDLAALGIEVTPKPTASTAPTKGTNP